MDGQDPEPTLAPAFYGVAGIDASCAAGLATLETAASLAVVLDAPLAFGQTDLSGEMVDPWPSGSGWQPQAGGLPCVRPARYRLHGATVHGPKGVVTLGRYILADSLHHVWPPRAGAWRDGSRWMQRNQFTAVRFEQAEHLLTGNCRNYFHWLLDGMARWALTPAGGPCLLPWSGLPFQAECLALLPSLAERARLLAPGQAVLVESLGWSGTVTGFGTAYHPLLRDFGAEVRQLVETASVRDVYIRRDDSGNRPLRNEAAVARLCADHGFTPVRLSDMPMRDQVALFAGARRIVAPHGAGLANLVFSFPGCAVLELHTPAYVNWCFRRLSATMQLRYGCLLGTGKPAPGDIHARGWSIDLEKLRASLVDPAFMEAC